MFVTNLEGLVTKKDIEVAATIGRSARGDLSVDYLYYGLHKDGFAVPIEVAVTYGVRLEATLKWFESDQGEYGNRNVFDLSPCSIHMKYDEDSGMVECGLEYDGRCEFGSVTIGRARRVLSSRAGIRESQLFGKLGEYVTRDEAKANADRNLVPEIVLAIFNRIEFVNTLVYNYPISHLVEWLISRQSHVDNIDSVLKEFVDAYPVYQNQKQFTLPDYKVRVCLNDKNNIQEYRNPIHCLHTFNVVAAENLYSLDKELTKSLASRFLEFAADIADGDRIDIQSLGNKYTAWKLGEMRLRMEDYIDAVESMIIKGNRVVNIVIDMHPGRTQEVKKILNASKVPKEGIVVKLQTQSMNTKGMK